MSKQALDRQEVDFQYLNTILMLIFIMSLTPVLELATRVRFNKDIQHLEGKVDV